MSSSFFSRINWVSGGICLLMLTLILCVGGVVARSKPAIREPDPFVLSEASDAVVQTSFLHKEAYPVSPKSRILLLPHHLVAGREIASLLSSTSPTKEVILLSPDHFAKGDQALSTTKKSFLWKNPETRISPSLQQYLLSSLPSSLRVQDEVFLHEHGVRGLIPFFKNGWPQSTVTPIAVRLDTANNVIDRLAEILEAQLRKDSDLTVVITIDFSHELPTYLANLHDAYALERLAALDETAASSVEIDSPPLFRLLTRLTRLEHASLKLQAHTNSLTLMRTTASEHGTSHILMSEEPHPPVASSSTRFTFVHDPGRPIVSSEDRAYRGYSEVKTASIPFPAVFVAEQTTTSTTWHAIPLRQTKDHAWELVSDQAFIAQKTQRTVWKSWANTHLTSQLGK